jgi:polyisoprenoid-binding protein YceI
MRLLLEAVLRVIKIIFLLVFSIMPLFHSAGTIKAAEPCKPFEDGRIDPQILVTMRKAATEGRMYRVNPEASKVGFCVRHFPYQEFRGEFTNIVGGLALPPDSARYGQALLLVYTASLKSDNTALMPLAKGRHFMDTARYPEILYVGQKFEWINDAHAHIYGELTLRGKTHPVVFEVDLNVPDESDDNWADRIRLRGVSQFNRFKYDMRSHQFFVSENIRLCVDAELLPWGS